MSVGNKVRIYDLAKELKQDTKRVMEELRREGADVSVASNSVSKEIADKVRNKYFPKKETSPARSIKVIKKVEKVNESPKVEAVEVEPAQSEPKPQVEEKKEKVITPALAKEAEVKPRTSLKILKPRNKVAIPEPETETVSPIEIEEVPVEVPATVQEEPVVEVIAPKTQTVEAKTQETTVETEKPKASKIFRPGTQVRKLSLTPEASKAGLKQGEKVA